MKTLRSMRQRLKTIVILVWLAALLCFGHARAGEPIVDSHFHIANYAMQGISLKTLIDRYMGDRVLRSVVFALPLQQKWDAFERFGAGRMPPNYYLGPKAGMYYYSIIDAMVALDYLKLSDADKARLDPMIVGFNPMDRYGVQHVKRMLLLFPGVFSGIGEFSVHKEAVADKISDDAIGDILEPGQPLPPDATAVSRNSLYNQSLKILLDFAAESGLIVNLHSDIYPARVTFDGRVLSLSPDAPHTEGMKRLCGQSPETKVCWAHTGLGRYVKPALNHLQIVADILDACPNWYADLSWDIVQQYIVAPKPEMPSLEDWASFVTRYQDRLLWGSDTVIVTKNHFDAEGSPVLGREMPVADYLAVTNILNPLWKKVGPDVARKVRMTNHLRLFDEARRKVRIWEAANRQENVWFLPAQ